MVTAKQRAARALFKKRRKQAAALMKKGKTRKQAWKIVKGKRSSKSKPYKPPKSSKSKKSGSKTAKKKRNTRRGFNYRSLMPVLKAGVFLAPGAIAAYEYRAHGIGGMFNAFQEPYTGYNFYTKMWNWSKLLEGWGPITALTFFSAVIPRLGGLVRRLI